MTVKRNSLRFIPLLILFLIACNLTSPQPPAATETSSSSVPTAPIAGDLGFGTVSGTVIDVSTGMPIAGAMVTCEHFSYVPRETDQCNRSMTTDQGGSFLFEDV